MVEVWLVCAEAQPTTTTDQHIVVTVTVCIIARGVDTTTRRVLHSGSVHVVVAVYSSGSITGGCRVLAQNCVLVLMGKLGLLTFFLLDNS